jgi:hypothetical protein
MRRMLLAAAALLGLAAAPASAQVTYNGWNLGPDYGAMVEGVNRQRQAQLLAMQQLEAQIVHDAMQDPVCQRHYQRHRAEGGQQPWAHFAFLCAATNRFDPEGIRQFRAVEQQNQSAEARRLAALRLAQQHRARAQAGHAAGYAANQNEAGHVLQGNSTWTDPRTGQRVVLPYVGSSVSQDPATGQVYARDPAGRQYALGRDGMWHPLQPR